MFDRMLPFRPVRGAFMVTTSDSEKGMTSRRDVLNVLGTTMGLGLLALLPIKKAGAADLEDLSEPTPQELEEVRLLGEQLYLPPSPSDTKELLSTVHCWPSVAGTCQGQIKTPTRSTSE